MLQPLTEQMNELQEKIAISNADWLMSAREKLGLIGLLFCLKPKKTLELGYHRGGATKWLAEFSEKVITVDVNEFVSDAPNQFHNVEAWNCPTLEAASRIKKEKLFFDLAIIDADHSRKAVSADINGIIEHSGIILMHDSFNPDCRKGMVDALKKQDSHAYYLDFIPSVSKNDGLWGGLAIAWKSQTPGLAKEFAKEISSFTPVAIQNSFRVTPRINTAKESISNFKESAFSKIRITAGRILGK
jgi:predicted O-methyltransferase YrrM